MAKRKRSVKPRRRTPANKKSPKNPKRSQSSTPQQWSELIVVTKPESGIRASKAAISSVTAFNVSPLEKLLRSRKASMTPLFGRSEERIQAHTAMATDTAVGPVPDLSVYYSVDAPPESMEALAEELFQLPMVDGAYVKPAVHDATHFGVNDMLATDSEAPSVTPDYSDHQIYLNAAPAGIDAHFAWTVAGGRGEGIRIIDIETGWRFSHEDLQQNQGGLLGGTPPTDPATWNHGTAVFGVIGGDHGNGFGTNGICPHANVRAFSHSIGLGNAIRKAADHLGPGDVLLLEAQLFGRRFNFKEREDGRGLIAVEWWPDNFAAIQYATSRGIVVVEAAGNGAENLDDPIYNQRGATFPSGWTNPFNRQNADSGAILVGAGAPPPGTHGKNHGPDRSRWNMSNYGSAVDVQGWGSEVTTCGYGTLQGGSDADLWYTDGFGGTSSASAIIAGTVGSIQGILKARNEPPYTAAQIRALFRSTGSPQQDAPGRPRTQRIGNRPDLNAIIQVLPGSGPIQLDRLFRYWNASVGDHFYTTDFGELGNGRHEWRFQRVQCFVLPRAALGAVPLHRYWNPTIGDHFYTTDRSELGDGRNGYIYEEIQCYVQPQRKDGTVALHRFWNPQIGDHFYTTKQNELGSQRGWEHQGVQCYVYMQRVLDPRSTNGSNIANAAIPRTFATNHRLAESLPCDTDEAMFEVEDLEFASEFRGERWGGVNNFDAEPQTPPAQSSFDVAKDFALNGSPSARVSADASEVTISIKLR